MGKFIQTFKNIGLAIILVAFVASPLVYTELASAAPTYSSSSYGVDEVFMGAGGANDMSSATYRGRASLGDTAVGNSASGSYQAYSGFTTNADPYIEMDVTTSSTDLGYLSTTATSSATTTFTVRTYLASGYNVVNGSDPPTNTSGGAAISTPAWGHPRSVRNSSALIWLRILCRHL